MGDRKSPSSVPEPRHGRRLTLGAVSLTRQRLPKYIDRAMEQVRDELEAGLISNSVAPNPDFTWISLVIRLGLKDDLRPEIGRPNKKYGDQPVSIETDCSDFLDLSDAELSERLLSVSKRALSALGGL